MKSDRRKIVAVIGNKAIEKDSVRYKMAYEIGKALVEGLFHQLLIAYATARIVKEVLIEDNTDVLIPPRRVKNHINGKLGRAEFFHDYLNLWGHLFPNWC